MDVFTPQKKTSTIVRNILRTHERKKQRLVWGFGGIPFLFFDGLLDLEKCLEDFDDFLQAVGGQLFWGGREVWEGWLVGGYTGYPWDPKTMTNKGFTSPNI